MSRKTELEKAIENKWCEEVRSDGCFEQKGNKWGDGYPDRLCLTPYLFFYWMEFKRPGGALDERQIERIYELRSMGHTVYVVDNIQQAMDIHNQEIRAAKKLHAYINCAIKHG
jgi:hypothetical protein